MKQHVFSPAGPIDEYRNSWTWTQWNGKTQQMFQSTKKTRETKEIQLEAKKSTDNLAS